MKERRLQHVMSLIGRRRTTSGHDDFAAVNSQDQKISRLPTKVHLKTTTTTIVLWPFFQDHPGEPDGVASSDLIGAGFCRPGAFPITQLTASKDRTEHRIIIPPTCLVACVSNVLRACAPPFPQIDIIGAMVIVWRVRGKIIRCVLCNTVCNNCAQRNAHTYEQT